MSLLSGADGLPAVREEIAAVTVLGEAHKWALRAKIAEAKLRRLRLWQAAALLQLIAWGVLFVVKG